jgi:type IV pilus assembly protein PilC
VGNVIIAQAIDKIKEAVNVGKDMASAMKKEKLFPPVAVQMVSLGEETGRLDELLMKTADFLDSEIDVTIQSLTSLLEPMLVLVLGFGVLTMALAVFLPMWNLVNVLKR